METTVINTEIKIGEQILFFKNAGMFVGIIEKETEKAVKVDYCWEPAGSAGHCIIYTYCTWIPKSAVINTESGDLTVKKWFINVGLNADKIKHIKKYYIENGEKKYI